MAKIETFRVKCFPYKVECPEFEAVRNMNQNGKSKSKEELIAGIKTTVDIVGFSHTGLCFRHPSEENLAWLKILEKICYELSF